MVKTSMEDKVDETRPYESTVEATDDDDKELLALGYKPSFKREFTNLATVCVVFSSGRGECVLNMAN